MAITTIVLSFGGVIAGVFGLLSSVLLTAFLSGEGSDLGIPAAWTAILAVGSLCYGALLCAGAVLLLKHRPLGRTLVIAGAAVAILLSLVSLGFGASMNARTFGSSLFGLIFPIATIVFALLPGTKEWCAQPQAQPQPQPQQWGPGQSF